MYDKHLLSCFNALISTQSLTPLCEEDNQAQEIIKKLEKSIVLLSQCTTRVASRAEMLGAINQVMVKHRGFVLPEGVGDVSKNKFSEYFCASVRMRHKRLSPLSHVGQSSSLGYFFYVPLEKPQSLEANERRMSQEIVRAEPLHAHMSTD